MDRSMSSRHHQPPSIPHPPSTKSSSTNPNSQPAPKDTVRRKPVPGSTSSSPAIYKNPSSFTSEDTSNDQANLPHPSITIPQISSQSPTILPRDLDQYGNITPISLNSCSHILTDTHEAILLTLHRMANLPASLPRSPT